MPYIVRYLQSTWPESHLDCIFTIVNLQCVQAYTSLIST